MDGVKRSISDLFGWLLFHFIVAFILAKITGTGVIEMFIGILLMYWEIFKLGIRIILMLFGIGS